MASITDSTGTTSYGYDISGNRVSITAPSGDVTTQTFAGTDAIQQTDSVSGATTNYFYGPTGVAELLNASGNPSYYGHDGLGSVTALTDSSGVATDQYAYDAFGENLATSGSTVQPFMFMGNEADSSTATGPLDFNAREYDPSTGAFLSQDPVAGNPQDPQTLDAYVYGDSNPFAEPDPTGMMTSQQGNKGPDGATGPSGAGYYMNVAGSEGGIDTMGVYCSGVGPTGGAGALVPPEDEVAQCNHPGLNLWSTVGDDATSAWGFVQKHKGLITAVLVGGGCVITGPGWGACLAIGLGAEGINAASTYHAYQEGDPNALANGAVGAIVALPSIGVATLPFEGTGKIVVRTVWGGIDTTTGAIQDKMPQ